jgi:hypothetical protein
MRNARKYFLPNFIFLSSSSTSWLQQRPLFPFFFLASSILPTALPFLLDSLFLYTKKSNNTSVLADAELE